MRFLTNAYWMSLGRTWAVYDGDVSILLVLRSILEWRTTERSLVVYGVGPFHRSKVEAQSWFPEQEYSGRDGPGRENIGSSSWHHKELRREDVIRSLLKSMWKTKKESNGARPTKKPRDLLPLNTNYRKLSSGRPWIRGDCKTTVDWVNGHAKIRARRSGWKKRWTLPELRGLRSLGLCGFWDGICDNGNCGAGILIVACCQIHRVGLLSTRSVCDAERGGGVC